MKTLRFAATLAALCTGLTVAPAAPPNVRLADFEMITLASGPNRIVGFTADGREALIVVGWRDNGNAHGFHLYVVLAPATGGGDDYNVVTFSVGDTEQTSIADAPHVDEDYVRSVRFGRAMLNGRREMLAIVASRQIVESYPAPALTRIQVLALRNRGDEPIGPVDYFEMQSDFVTTRRYCNSDAALHAELGVPLPVDYSGSDRPDGCL